MAEQLFFKASGGGRILKANAGTVSSSSGNMSAEDFWKGRGFSTITPQEFKARERAFSQLGIKQAKKVSSQDLSRLDAFVAQQLKPLDQQVGAGGLKDTRALSPEESTAQAQERFFNDPANVSTQPDFKIASGPITADKQFEKDGKPFDPSKFTNLEPGTEDFNNFLKEQGITEAPKTDSLIDINDVGKVDETVIQKSTDMNTVKQRVLDSVANAPKGADSLANDAFIQGVAQASRGREASEDELKHVSEGGMIGASLRDVMKAFGIDGDLPDGGVIDEGIEFRAGISEDQKQSVRDLLQKPRDQWTPTDIQNFNFATNGSEKAPEAPTTDLPTVTDTTGGTGGATDTPGATPTIETGSALDKTDKLANNFLSDKTAIRTGAKEGAGVSEIQTAINEASKISNDYQTKIEQMQADLNLQDILNDETRIALESKVTGQGIPMKTINRQLTKEMNDLSQEQRIDRLYDVYGLNTQINAFNAQNRQVSMLNGQYDNAMENVKETVDDWTEMQSLKLDVLEQQGVLEKESRAQAQSELDFQRDLRLEGYTPIDDTETYNKIVKDLNVTAGNFNQFFFKDTNGKMYLKPTEGVNTQIVTVGGRKQLINTQTGDIIKDLGSSSTGGSGGPGAKQEDINEFDFAQGIIDANPGASNEELKVALQKNTKLSVSEINSLISAIPDAPKPESFSPQWFEQKIAGARADDFSDAEIKAFIIDNFDQDELHKTAKKEGFAKVFTGKETDIKRYIDSLLTE